MIISALSQKLYLTLHGSYKSTTYFSYSYLSHNYSGNGLNKLQWIRIRKVELVRVFLQLFFTFETHSIFFFLKRSSSRNCCIFLLFLANLTIFSSKIPYSLLVLFTVSGLYMYFNCSSMHCQNLDNLPSA